MFSFLSSYNQARLQSKQYKAQEKVLRNNAKGVRNRAASQAQSIRQTAQDNQLIATENLMTAQSNKRHKEAQARTAMGYSGFDTGEGTGGQALANLQQQLDAEIANMEQAASINLLNAWQSSIDTQRQGEIEARSLDAQADQYKLAAKSIRKTANLGLIAGAINSLAGAFSGYKSGITHNENMQLVLAQKDAAAKKQFDAGTINRDQYDLMLAENAINYHNNAVNPWANAFDAASSAGYSGFHFVNSFNPYTGALSADANNRKNNWGGVSSILSGNVPYKIPAAGTIFAQY